MRSWIRTLLAFGVLLTSIPSGLAAQQRIDRVEINGVTAFTQTEIESALEIGPGDLIDRGKILRTVENLTNLYHNHGFQSAEIQDHLNGDVLVYDVTEGKPTLISSISIRLVDSENSKLQKYWDQIEPRLREKLSLKPGDLLDQDKLNNTRHAIQEALNSEEFVGATITDVQILPGHEPAGIQIPKTPVEKWQQIDFIIDLGDRVSFGFRGNKTIPTTRMTAIIEDMKVIGLGKDYVEAIRSRIEDEYRSLGFAKVSIQVFPFERPEQHERHITYIIDEGPRITIEDVHFDGNRVFSNDELKTEFFSKASDVVSHGYYVEKDVQKAAELVVEYMKSKGYLSAKVSTINKQYLLKPRKIDSNRSVDLTIYIYEGEQTVIRKVDLAGNRALSNERVQKILRIKEGEPLNLFAFTEGIENLKAAYRNRGYLSVRIANENTNTVVNYSEENRVADISLQIVEGPLYKVGTVSVEGLVQTKEYVVRRELLFREGEVLKESQITGSEARLHRLGIFSVITIRATDDPDHIDVKNIKVLVQEGTPGLVAGGVGIRNDLGLRVFNQVGYQNLWGENHTMILNSAANHRFEDFRFVEYETQLAYVWPWFMWGETTFRPTATLSGTQYIDFDSVTAQLALTWERKLLDSPNLTGLFTYSLERALQFNSPDASENQGLRIGSVTPQLSLDMRDSPLAPTTGFFATASYEFASPYLLSQHDPYPIGYTIASFRADYYQPVTRDITLYLSFRTGYERSLEQPVTNPVTGEAGTSGTIPLIKQFALGGIDSVRGYQDQEINHSLENVFALSYVNYRTELDLPFAGALKIAGFLDAANLIDDSYSFTRGLLYGSGFGLRYETPVGPVNLDWGFKLNPLPDTGTQQFYFSIGVI